MGGKFKLSDWIESYFPKHRCYVEVFGGGASVLLTKTPSLVEVYNDIWDNITNLFLVLRDKPQKLQEWLRLTPVSHLLFDEYRDKLLKNEFVDDVEKAGITFFVLRCSRNGDITADWHLSPERNHASQIKLVTDNLYVFSERFRGVIIENFDFEECIRRYDNPETLFYCDPPYMGLSYYNFKFEYRDHNRLANLLKEIEGKVIVSYYENEEVRDLYSDEKWHFEERVVSKHSADVVDGERPLGKELLIMNFEPTTRSATSRMLREEVW
jgi:DNA adenine methylase